MHKVNCTLTDEIMINKLIEFSCDKQNECFDSKWTSLNKLRSTALKN